MSIKNTMHKKRSEICICCRVSEAKFYLYHSTKIANARPPLGMSSRVQFCPGHDQDFEWWGAASGVGSTGSR